MLIRMALVALMAVNLLNLANAQESPDGGLAQGSIQQPSLSELTRRAAAKLEAANATPELRGSGPYAARMETDFALPDATLYRPANLSAMDQGKLGVVIWGNGGCSNDGASARNHLAQIASYGYLVIAPGRMLSGPTASEHGPAAKLMQITIEDMRHALDWVVAENSRPGSPFFERIDTNAIAASGHSCGGMLAILLADDPRIKTTIIHNSGIFQVMPDNPPFIMHEQRLQGIRSSVLLVMGGEDDLAYSLGTRAYQLMNGVPVAFASIAAGHEGTFAQMHGGKAAKVAVSWLEWQLRRDESAANTFVGGACGLCADRDWEYRIKGFAD